MPPYVDPEQSGTGTCEVMIPAGEIFESRHKVSVSNGNFAKSVPIDSTVFARPWFSVAIQSFPDGRCGVAIDGRQIWLSPGGTRNDAPFSVILGYSSFQSRILHGAVDVWTGVRGGIEWDRSGPTR